MQACLSSRKDGESILNHFGGVVKLVQTCLSARKDRESNFYDSGSAVKLVKAS